MTSKVMTKEQWNIISRRFDLEQRVVYFVQEASGICAIKIGLSTNSHLLSRLDSLSSGNPRRLTIIGVEVGSQEYEQKLHYIFRKYSIKGEWFLPDKKILNHIERHCIKPPGPEDEFELDIEDEDIIEHTHIHKATKFFKMPSTVAVNSDVNIASLLESKDLREPKTKSQRRRHLLSRGLDIEADSMNGEYWREWISEGEDE